ncbi:hypothetical protein ACQ7JO_004589, partial [Vibrio parahaemolyticus]
MCHCSKSTRQGSQSRLGINTESSSPSTGECTYKTDQIQLLRALRRERFLLSKIARGIFAKQGEKEG